MRPASLRTMRAFAREPIELESFRRFLAVPRRLGGAYSVAEVQNEMQERKMLVFRLPPGEDS